MSAAAGKKFSGVYTALVTPFQKGEVDFKSLERLVKSQIAGGVNGFVVNGTTGESPTLKPEEVKDIFSLVRKLSDVSQKVILGIGTNDTRTTVEWAQRAQEWKADGALAVVPYYNKPPQRGLLSHFKTVAENTTVPVVLYNVPGRTVAALELETIVQLSRQNGIVGIKESTGNLQFMREIKAKVSPEFVLLSGDDESCVDFCFQGGDGVISVCSHVIPKETREHLVRAKNGDAQAVQEFKMYKDLMRCLYVEANPIPVKKALELMGIISSAEMRLPLVSLDETHFGDMTECLKKIKKI